MTMDRDQFQNTYRFSLNAQTDVKQVQQLLDGDYANDAQKQTIIANLKSTGENWVGLFLDHGDEQENIGRIHAIVIEARIHLLRKNYQPDSQPFRSFNNPIQNRFNELQQCIVIAASFTSMTSFSGANPVGSIKGDVTPLRPNQGVSLAPVENFGTRRSLNFE